MGNSNFSKSEIKELTDRVGIVESTLVDLAKHLDSIQAIAETFKCGLGKLDTDSRDDDSSNAGKLYEKLMNVYALAMPLLVKIEAVQMQKIFTMDSVNNSLCVITKRIGKRNKTRADDFNNQSLDNYLAVHRSATPSHKHSAIPEEHQYQSKPLNMQPKVPKLEKKHTHIKGKAHSLSSDNYHSTAVKTKFRGRNSDTEQEIDITSGRGTGPEASEKMTGDEDFQTHQQVTKLQMENKSLKLNIEQLEQQISITKSELERSRLNNIYLNETVDQDKNDIEEKNRLMREMQISISKLKTDNKIQQDKSTAALDGAKMKMIELEKTNHTVQQDNETLKLELQKLVNKNSLQVQIYCHQRGDLMATIEDELMSLLKTRMGLTSMELEFRQCTMSSSIKHDTPLLLLCIMASRLGTDVSNAIQGITLTSKMAVLIFHHKDVHALPSQASARVLTGPQFAQLGGIFDMAFLCGKGIYSCRINNENIINVLNFIKEAGDRIE